MANPHKGEIELKTKEKTYILCFNIDALCRLEQATGKTFTELAIDLSKKEKMSLTLVRDFMHAGLHKHHPELTFEEAGELVLAAGGMLTVMQKVTEALQAAFPEASGTPRPPNRANRRQAGSRKAGSGPRSSKTGSR